MGDPVNAALAKALESVADLLQRIAGPLADEVGDSFAISYRPYRVKLGLRALQKTQRMLKEAGIGPQAVPPRLFLPMVEAASIEDDEDLHTRWAALLANAATSPDLVHPSYIEVLKQLTPVEARLLDALYKIAKGKKWQKVETTDVTDEEFKTAGAKLFAWFSSLVRLGLIQISFDIDRKSREIKVKVPNIDMSKYPGYAGVEAEGYFDGDLEETYLFTDFAVDFVNACRPPKTIEGSTTEHSL
jgi:abortive infection alpha-like protein